MTAPDRGIVAFPGAMFNVILLSLGMLLSSAPGLGGLSSLRRSPQSPPAALHSLPLLHPAAPLAFLPRPRGRRSNPRTPRRRRRNRTIFLLVCDASRGRPDPAIGRRDGAIVRACPRGTASSASCITPGNSFAEGGRTPATTGATKPDRHRTTIRRDIAVASDSDRDSRSETTRSLAHRRGAVACGARASHSTQRPGT